MQLYSYFTTYSYLHAAYVYRQHSGEEEHLQVEVGEQPDHGEQTELLHTNQTHVYMYQYSSTTRAKRTSTCTNAVSATYWYTAQLHNVLIKDV